MPVHHDRNPINCMPACIFLDPEARILSGRPGTETQNGEKNRDAMAGVMLVWRLH
jgi:hypothetical protein